MSIDEQKEQVETIKRRLNRKDAWHHNYLDDLVDSEMRALANRLANNGPRAQSHFLLNNGWTVKEIVKHGRRTRKSIYKHMKEMHKPRKKR